ncbi:iron complex transport system ATP-binding protein [Microbacteriaceae bacterium SG_E_30_P1]|uniref:Iron complex transport system ATP-binding protein n=1 Tax=Antiquaquibacter oligotrophicus TaxID=2880260 RepID=A0ABT6KQD2_9MICO|nr:heme ABC transporter ATP-binding protein [Antiquaquibacter oligotrophicus]MDH6182196.1 iron complex transport system ATP-binding protein [Antiquaquibacter oligotrophicus]UDF12144.1 heme ABC transporter ATP-binding protein [Antiquaquibacter oligotrophicus]
MVENQTPRIAATDVTVELDGARVLDSVSLDVRAGEVLALVGPNGAGKSTLLGVLSGERRPSRGNVTLDGRELSSIRSAELARLRSVLTQDNQVSFPFRVIEVVSMGRSPWARSVESRDDIAAVHEAMDAADIHHLAERRYTQLSGGERARVSLARVLAQRATTVFLDEPTAALDLRHQEDVMRQARGLAESGCAVVVVLHDLSLAGAYADRIALIANGRLEAAGTPVEVLTEERVERVYGLPVDLHLVAGRPVVVPTRD